MKWLKGFLFGRPPGMSPFPAGRGPARLIVMRHAEKTGDKNDRHLSKKGQQRAEGLVRYIPERFGPPGFLLAASRNPRSDRPVDTLKPMADALALSIIDHIDDEDTAGVVDFLTAGDAFKGQLGVISWRHSDLPDLIAALGAPEGTYPAAWPEAEYDIMIEIDYRTAGIAPQVRQHVFSL